MVERLLAFCAEPKSASEILNFLELKSRGNLMQHYLTPLLEKGVLAMTQPDVPTSRNQKYVRV